MPEPIVFISHNVVKEGKLDAFRNLYQESALRLQEQKPATLAFLAYLSEDGGEVSIVQVFPDADAMDLQIQGADERSKRTYEFIQPKSIEIFGTPNERVLEKIKQIAGSGVMLSIRNNHLGGFLRIEAG